MPQPGVIPFRLLQDALPVLVRSLSEAPLLLMTHGHGKQRILPIPRTVDVSDIKVWVNVEVVLVVVAASPPSTQAWDHYAALLRAERPELYVFAEEVVCGGDDCVLSRPSTTHEMQSLSPVPTTSQCAEELTDVNAPRMSGRLGDCCDEETQQQASSNNIVPLLVHQQQCSHSQSSVRFWGLVVRAWNHDDPVEGCYLLKTSQNTDLTGCTCIHYSLTKVKQGESLYEQLVQSWLV